MSRNLFKFFLIAAASLILSTATAGAGVIFIKTAPPAVKIEVRPHAPFAKAVWIPGHWTWKRGRYVWAKGHYVKHRKGFAWVPGHWKKRRAGWVWVGGHWKRI